MSRFATTMATIILLSVVALVAYMLRAHIGGGQ